MAKRDIKFNEYIIIRYCQEYLPAEKISDDVLYNVHEKISKGYIE